MLCLFKRSLVGQDMCRSPIHYCRDHCCFTACSNLAADDVFEYSKNNSPQDQGGISTAAVVVELMSPVCNVSALYPKVLPNRTHPLLLMSGGGGYVLSGTTVVMDHSKPAASQQAEEPAPKRPKLTDTEG